MPQINIYLQRSCLVYFEMALTIIAMCIIISFYKDSTLSEIVYRIKKAILPSGIKHTQIALYSLNFWSYNTI